MKFATIFKEDLEYISRCILDYPDIETGGDFFGFWNNLGFPVIQYVTGQGKNSYQHVTFFKQDVNYLLEIGNAAYQSFGMQHIGSWHSHHQLGLAVPSGHDCQTMANAVNNNGLNHFFMILGNVRNDRSTVNGFLFDKENQRNYTETRWNILIEKNPFKENIEKLIRQDVFLPRTAKAKFDNLKLINNTKTGAVVLNPEDEIDITNVKNMFCTQCGFRLQGDAQFCPKCGVHIQSENTNPNKEEEREKEHIMPVFDDITPETEKPKANKKEEKRENEQDIQCLNDMTIDTFCSNSKFKIDTGEETRIR